MKLKNSFSILEEYGIEPHAFGVRGVNGWHNYVWQRIVELDGFLSYDDIKIIYLSKLKYGLLL